MTRPVVAGSLHRVVIPTMGHARVNTLWGTTSFRFQAPSTVIAQQSIVLALADQVPATMGAIVLVLTSEGVWWVGCHAMQPLE